MAVAGHHTLRAPGRTARVSDGHHIAGPEPRAHRVRRTARGLPQQVPAQATGRAQGEQKHRGQLGRDAPRQRRTETLRIEDERGRARVADHRQLVPNRTDPVDHRDPATDHVRRQPHQERLGPIAHQHGHPRPTPQTARQQRPRQPVHPVKALTCRQPTLPAPDRDPVRIPHETTGHQPGVRRTPQREPALQQHIRHPTVSPQCGPTTPKRPRPPRLGPRKPHRRGAVRSPNTKIRSQAP